MKGKDKKALHTKTLAELNSLLSAKRGELIKARMELKMNKTKNVHLGQTLRNEIARIQTIMRIKEISNG